MLGRYFADRNRAYNDTFVIDGYICSQCDEPVCRMRYGCKTMDYNGCEVIACYHALLSLGMPAAFSEVADTCSRIGLWLFGLFGTRPRALYRFCRSYGLGYRRYSQKDFDRISEDVVLYAYWNPRFHGIHTVELHRCAQGYLVTNLGYLRGAVFGTMGEVLHAIRTPMPILCLGITRNPTETPQNRKISE